MTDYFETRVENLELKEDKKISSRFHEILQEKQRRGKGKSPTRVL